MVAQTVIPDGMQDFSGGMNAGVAPHALAPNQYYRGVNVSISTNSLRPRWGIEDIELDFSECGEYTRPTGQVVTFESLFYNGKYQGFIPYGIGVTKYALYLVSGYCYLISYNTGKVIVLNKDTPLNYYSDRLQWSNAGRFVVIFDWPEYPLILEGLNARRADPDLNECPVAVMGCYNQNRLCVANAGIDWTAGDPSGSRFTPNAPVSFLEYFLDASPYFGDSYQVPTANQYSDSITAMGFLQYVDNSTGIGPMFVSTQNAVYTYRTDLPRSQWQGSANSIVFGSMLLPTTGVVGQRAHTNVNSDLLFLGNDGQVYALSMSRNDQRRWGNSPISKEVEDFLQYVDRDIAYVGVAKYFKNHVFFTCNPHRVNCISPDGVPQTDYTNAGVVVMETNIVSGIAGSTPPVWTGLWTGVMFNDFAEVDGTLFIAGKVDGRNKLLRFTPDKSVDYIDGKFRDIRCIVETKEFEHQDATQNKELHSLDLGLRELEEKIKVDVEYKPSTAGAYFPWETREFIAPVEQKGYPLFPNGLTRQGIRDYTIGGDTEDQCIPGTNDIARVYKGVQLRLILTGRYWELEYLKLKGRVLPNSEVQQGCSEIGNSPSPERCFNYFEIPGGCK